MHVRWVSLWPASIRNVPQRADAQAPSGAPWSVVAKHPTPFLLFFSGAAAAIACTPISAYECHLRNRRRRAAEKQKNHSGAAFL